MEASGLWVYILSLSPSRVTSWVAVPSRGLGYLMSPQAYSSTPWIVEKLMIHWEEFHGFMLRCMACEFPHTSFHNCPTEWKTASWPELQSMSSRPMQSYFLSYPSLKKHIRHSSRNLGVNSLSAPHLSALAPVGWRKVTHCSLLLQIEDESRH